MLFVTMQQVLRAEAVEKVQYESSFRNDPDLQISTKTLVHLHLKTLVQGWTSYFRQMDRCDTNSTSIYV